jgi:hypothetical protein
VHSPSPSRAEPWPGRCPRRASVYGQRITSWPWPATRSVQIACSGPVLGRVAVSSKAYVRGAYRPCQQTHPHRRWTRHHSPPAEGARNPSPRVGEPCCSQSRPPTCQSGAGICTLLQHAGLGRVRETPMPHHAPTVPCLCAIHDSLLTTSHVPPRAGRADDRQRSTVGLLPLHPLWVSQFAHRRGGHATSPIR